MATTASSLRLKSERPNKKPRMGDEPWVRHVVGSANNAASMRASLVVDASRGGQPRRKGATNSRRNQAVTRRTHGRTAKATTGGSTGTYRPRLGDNLPRLTALPLAKYALRVTKSAAVRPAGHQPC